MDDLAPSLRARVAGGPDPDEAPARLHRFLEATSEHGGPAACIPDETAADLLVLLLSQSPWAARELIREPLRLAALARDPFLRREKPESTFLADAQAACAEARDASALQSALRRFRDAEYVRLAARELGFGAAVEVGRELAALASACLDVALAFALRETEARLGTPRVDESEGQDGPGFVVMGMGKLGAEELNFSSDIDLIYLYETDAGTTDRGASLHEFFAKLAERLTQLVSASGCFRIDLRLRPEGSRGPIVNALPAAERYYETWGRAWERQAWIKARPVAGDREFGARVLAALQPYVWPRSGVSSAIEDVQEMMRKVRAELRDDGDVKLGRGGIREVEFFAQALQRVHGGRRPELRERGTLAALDRLLFAGLVTAREHRVLGDAYVVLRRVEHRLQLEELRQTHALPQSIERRALLARRLGYEGAAELDSRLGAQRDAVAAIYATLGRADDDLPPPVLALLDPESDRAAVASSLAALGFRDVEASADELLLLRGKPRGPFSPVATGAARRAAPHLLAEAAASPDPDLALRRLVDLAARGPAAEIVYRLAGEAPAIGRLLVSLFGTSDFLSKILVAHPELLEPLVIAGGPPPPRGREGHLAAIAARLAAAAADGEGPLDEEDHLNLLRRYQHDELLRVGLRDVGGELRPDEVSTALTDLAEACIEATLDAVRPAVERRFGVPRTPFSVLALGKLGAGELGYASDLDLLFLFGDDEAIVDAPPGGTSRTAFEVMSRLAQRLIHGLGAHLPAGRLYEVDTRLRPSGQQGALVSSLGGFARYHAGRSALWERQALIKLRTVAGDRALGGAAEAIAQRHVWEGPPLDAQAAATEIGHLRARMERELAREAPGRFHVKLGRGGLVDVEFLVQYLQLLSGGAHPTVRARGTRPALDALRALSLLDDADHAALTAGYDFLRRLESRMRIVHDRSISELREDPVELDKLARRLGLRGARAGAMLIEEYHAQTREIRRVYGRFLPVPTDSN